MSCSKIISTIVFSTLLIVCLVSPSSSEQGKFTLSSPEIPKKGQMKEVQVFSGFGCSGQNISPALAWKNFPPETKSFALMVYDPDAPTGSGWWHWIVYNIPAKVNSLPAGAGKAEGSLCCLKEPFSRIRTLAAPVTAVHARQRVTSPIVMCSPSLP